MSFVIDEPEVEKPRRVYGVAVRVIVIRDRGNHLVEEQALVQTVIPLTMGPVVLMPGDVLDAHIIDPDGRYS